MLSYEYPPLGGGGAKVVQGLTKSLASAGHEIDLITMGFSGMPPIEIIDGVQVHRIDCGRRKKDVSTIRELLSYAMRALPFAYRLASRNRYDLNHTHFIYPDGLISYVLWKRLRLPFIITAHGSDVPGYNPHRFVWEHRILAPAWRAITGAAAQIICPSRTLQDLVLQASSKARVTIIPNGIDTKKFTPSDKNKKKILIVTRMLERKGVRYVLEALQGFGREAEVNIVGDGPDLKEFKRLAERLGVTVNFRGWLENESPELRALYETSSIFILASESENFPIVLLEAMAAGLAIITTRGTGCEEVVGDAGYLVPPRDSSAIRTALIEFMEDERRTAILGHGARRRLEEHFGWQTVSMEYLKVYKKFIKYR